MGFNHYGLAWTQLEAILTQQRSKTGFHRLRIHEAACLQITPGNAIILDARLGCSDAPAIRYAYAMIGGR
ncbi:hypothetical protein MGR01S_08790 [Meiothermus granaticius NBRC 107808]|nr:hypothetical protein MGR01S_08790 [Meiothermus granaticius NBRC 107808]